MQFFDVYVHSKGTNIAWFQMLSFECILVSLVVARKNDRFCATHETRGYYLPAGRVDAGETFTTAAHREAQEEAGLNARLTRLLRFDYNLLPRRMARFRAHFLAEPADDAPLKSVPDEESLGAEWLTIEEMRQKPVRSLDVLMAFAHVKSGARGYPLNVLEGFDGAAVDHQVVVTRLRLRAAVVVWRDGKCLCMHNTVESKESKEKTALAKLPVQDLTEAHVTPGKDRNPFVAAASQLVPPALSSGVQGIVQISHSAPPHMGECGLLQVTFAGRPGAPSEARAECVGWVWLTPDQMREQLTRAEFALAEKARHEQLLCPLDVMQYEGNAWKIE